jgi:hypothetical protein
MTDNEDEGVCVGISSAKSLWKNNFPILDVTMPAEPLNESTVESIALSWFTDLGYEIRHGEDIAPGEPGAERDAYTQVILLGRLRAAVERLNPQIPAEARDEAIRKVLYPESPSLVANNRKFHGMLRDGVEVEYRRRDGSIAGDRVRLIDYDDPDNNDWLVVNQFTVIEAGHNRRADVVVFINGLAGPDRIEEPRRRERDDLGRLHAASDVQPADPVAVRLQRDAGRFGRAPGPHRLADRQPGMVQAVADDRRRRRGPVHDAGTGSS